MTFMEKSAMELLLKCGIHRFPVDAEQIARELDYNLVDYQSGAQLIESAGLDYMYIYEGFSAKIGKKYYIFFKEGLSRERKNWIIAHEIAHIKHHLVSAGLIGRAEGQKEKQLLEQEAETFAKALLAPLYVLTHMKIVEPADIERITGLEPDKAQEVFLDLSEYEAERKERLLQNRVSKQFHVKRRHRFPWQVLLPLCICLLAVGIFRGSRLRQSGGGRRFTSGRRRYSDRWSGRLCRNIRRNLLLDDRRRGVSSLPRLSGAEDFDRLALQRHGRGGADDQIPAVPLLRKAVAAARGLPFGGGDVRFLKPGRICKKRSAFSSDLFLRVF